MRLPTPNRLFLTSISAVSQTSAASTGSPSTTTSSDEEEDDLFGVDEGVVEDVVFNAGRDMNSPSSTSAAVWGGPGYTGDLDHDSLAHHHELLRLLTDRLEEQVGHLLSLSFSSTNAEAFCGLHQTLVSAIPQILHLSKDEPYGVRGANIKVSWKSAKRANNVSALAAAKAGEENDSELLTLGAIAMDTNTVSTFNLHFILQEERRLAVSIRNWLVGQFTGGRSKPEVVISPHYVLQKEKLYRSPSGSTLSAFQM